MKKLAIFDVDGTILNSDGCLIQSVLESFRKLESNDIDLSIATGRPWALVGDIAARLPLNVPLILSNGSVLFDPKRTTVVEQDCIPKDSLASLLDGLQAFGLLWSAYTPTAVYTVDADRLERLSSHYASGPGQSQNIVHLSDLRDLPSETVNSISVKTRDSSEKELLKSKTMDLPGLSLRDSGFRYIDILPSQSHKASALSRLVDLHYTEKPFVFSVGDGQNDMELFERADYSIALANAYWKLKSMASQITRGDNNTDGITEATNLIIEYQRS
jgi:Cof subfamily protein (haloacid dehalogenase superfamily)